MHISCLREWLNQKRKVSSLSDYQTNYIYKKATCEICGFLYPDMVRARGKSFPVFDFARPTGCNYMVIEVLGMPLGKNFSVIEVLEDYKLEIGRNETEINIPDVSVSKKHGFIRFDPNIRELILLDQGSKHGSSVLIQRPVKLNLDQTNFFICGLSLLKITVRDDWWSQYNCCAPPIDIGMLEKDCKSTLPTDLQRFH